MSCRHPRKLLFPACGEKMEMRGRIRARGKLQLLTPTSFPPAGKGNLMRPPLSPQAGRGDMPGLPLFHLAAREHLARLWIAALFVFSLSFPAFASEGVGGAADPFIYRLMVFVLSIFVGYYVVWSVTPALHTPLMSVTNAISSVIAVGALLAVGVAGVAAGSLIAKIFGFLALTMASVNIFGGFLVTQRMLAMYRKKTK